MRPLRWIIALFLTLQFAIPVSAMQHDHGEMPSFKPVIIDPNKKSELQTLINDTPAGGVLQLEDKVYRGVIQITKPITIRGTAETQIYSLSTIFSMTDTENVTLENVTLKADELAVIATNVKNLKFSNVRIEEANGGIQIFNSENITFDHLTISGPGGHFSTKENAVAIYESKQVTMTNNDIWDVLDGFYLESVKGITGSGNTITDSRYGFHMMYSDDSKLHNNTLMNNMTGLMIMIAKNVELTDNKILRQRSLNSLGVYLYDVENVAFRGNAMTENTTAMDIQQARALIIEDNVFTTNGTVFQVKRSETALITNNELNANILTVRTDHQGVQLVRNMYDDYTGDDFDKNGIGDTPHIAANAFGQWMVKKPVYQYFMESPSVVTLNLMETDITDTKNQLVLDAEPVVKVSTRVLQLDVQPVQLAVSGAALIGLLMLRRKWK
ncbi:MAG: right-handed parallel beta-helix repeat-containing protein [Solibacillus sp.]